MTNNRETAIRYITTGGDPDLLTSDAKWWTRLLGTQPMTEFRESVAHLREIMPKSPVMTITSVVAEGDKVAIECDGRCEMADGSRYDNRYHYAFFFRDGKICEVHEHCDTKLATETFGKALGVVS